MTLRLLLLAGAAAVGFAASADATTFNLNSVTATSLPFSITAGGVTASFSSTSGNDFSITPTAGLLNFDPVLSETTVDPLTISFSAPQTGLITLPFVVFDNNFLDSSTPFVATINGTTQLNLVAYESGFSLYLQGVAQFYAPTPISTLTLSSPQYAIGVGSLSVTTPEPASLAILGFGLASLAGLRRRRS